eukprot:GHVP01018352.1.p1 GENE.GHVP01018352.1~~GHVP01018352.1.p1  ORF type:complete len:190 (-),score=25.02 GHVP01018352.1:125-694(-)
MLLGTISLALHFCSPSFVDENLDIEICQHEWEVTEDHAEGNCGKSHDDPCPTEITNPYNDVDKIKCGEIVKVSIANGGSLWVESIIIWRYTDDLHETFRDIVMVTVDGAAIDEDICPKRGEVELNKHVFCNQDDNLLTTGEVEDGTCSTGTHKRIVTSNNSQPIYYSKDSLGSAFILQFAVYLESHLDG